MGGTLAGFNLWLSQTTYLRTERVGNTIRWSTSGDGRVFSTIAETDYVLPNDDAAFISIGLSGAEDTALVDNVVVTTGDCVEGQCVERLEDELLVLAEGFERYVDNASVTLDDTGGELRVTTPVAGGSPSGGVRSPAFDAHGKAMTVVLGASVLDGQQVWASLEDSDGAIARAILFRDSISIRDRNGADVSIPMASGSNTRAFRLLHRPGALEAYTSVAANVFTLAGSLPITDLEPLLSNAFFYAGGNAFDPNAIEKSFVLEAAYVDAAACVR